MCSCTREQQRAHSQQTWLTTVRAHNDFTEQKIFIFVCRPPENIRLVGCGNDQRINALFYAMAVLHIIFYLLVFSLFFSPLLLSLSLLLSPLSPLSLSLFLSFSISCSLLSTQRSSYLNVRHSTFTIHVRSVSVRIFISSFAESVRYAWMFGSRFSFLSFFHFGGEIASFHSYCMFQLIFIFLLGANRHILFLLRSEAQITVICTLWIQIIENVALLLRRNCWNEWPFLAVIARLRQCTMLCVCDTNTMHCILCNEHECHGYSKNQK